MQLSQRFLAALLAVSVGAPPALVSATAEAAVAPSDGDLAEAKTLYERGKARFDAGSFTEAAGLFISAFEKSGEPNLLYNASYAFERANDYENALKYLRKYQELAPPEERANLDEEIAQLEKRKEAAENGEEIDTERISAEPDNGEKQPVPTDDGPTDKKRIFGPGAAVLTATTAIGAGLAIGFGVVAFNRHNTIQDECSGDASLCPGDVEDLEQQRKTFAGVADAGIALAAVSAIALTTVLLVNNSRAKRSKATALRVGPGVTRSSAGVSVVGRF